MTEFRNHAKDRLAAGEISIGIGLRQARTVDTGRIMRTCGFDWLFIDMEHNAMSVEPAVQLSVAAQDAGITPFVRVPDFAHHHATRVLDGGAMGIVAPHVDTAEEAARIVANCKFRPIGHRAIAGAQAQLYFAAQPLGDTARAVNEATLVVIMLETPRAIENLDEIARVPGIDVLLIGTNDLCMEMGIPGQLDDPRIEAVYVSVAAACRANGIHPGMGGVYAPALMERYIALGMRFVLAGSDLSLMMAAGAERTAFLRGLSP
jgi:2-keto-3-deoxy-L-rhamnonate aldolase RhmA